MVSDYHHRLLAVLARTMAGLPLSIAEGLLPFRLATL
jgi:hypothetical protein